jgi:nucleoid-associated protein YgaU
VRPGDCLSHIAAAVLSPGADALEIEEEVERLWRLNEDRIGTGDPDLIYPGTVLRLR